MGHNPSKGTCLIGGYQGLDGPDFYSPHPLMGGSWKICHTRNHRVPYPFTGDLRKWWWVEQGWAGKAFWLPGTGNLKCHGKGRDFWGLYSRESREFPFTPVVESRGCIYYLGTFDQPSQVVDKEVDAAVDRQEEIGEQGEQGASSNLLARMLIDKGRLLPAGRIQRVQKCSALSWVCGKR